MSTRSSNVASPYFFTNPSEGRPCTEQIFQSCYPDSPKRDLFHIAGWRIPSSGKWKDRELSLLKIRRLLRVFAAEVRSLGVRMRFQYRQALLLAGVGVCLHLAMDHTGVLRPHKRSLACIRDMKKFLAAHPWATDFDRMLFRDAWLEGAKYADDIADTPERNTQASKHLTDPYDQLPRQAKIRLF
jgi:hypothetical protein